MTELFSVYLEVYEKRKLNMSLPKNNKYILSLAYFLNKEELERLSEGIPLSHESLSIRNAVDALGVKRVVESVGIKRVVEEVGIERVIEEVGPEYLFQNMLEVASEDDLKKFRQMLHMR